MMRSPKINSENLVILAYCICAAVFILDSTQLKYIGGWTYVTKISKLLVLGIILLSFLVSRKITFKWFAAGSVVGIVSVFSYLQCGQSNLFLLAAFFMAGVHLKSEKLLKSYALTASAAVLMTLLLYAAGIYEYDAIFRSDGIARLYLGFTYTTYCANYLFHILLVYVALKKKEISVKETLVISLLNVMVYQWTDTKAVFYEIFLMLAVLWLMRIWPRLFCGKLFRFAVTWTMPLLAAGSVYLSYAYDASSSIYLALDKLLSTRLSLGNAAIQKYGFSLFGNEVTWVTGRLGIERTEEYFYVDCSYLNILLTFGVVTLLLVIIGFVALGRKACLEKKYFLCVALLMLAVHSFSDPQLFELRYDPFLILLGTMVLKRGEIPLDADTKCSLKLPKVRFRIRRQCFGSYIIPVRKGSTGKDASGKEEIIENREILKA